ncbi:tetratricopeptide repeat protein [bacterium]|nr:tetratricopeptide repeat protein [bacterium]
MVKENVYREHILDFKQRFRGMCGQSQREGEWLRSYSYSLLNYLDILDELPEHQYTKEAGLAEHIHETALLLTELGDYFTAIDVFQRLATRCLSARNYNQAGRSFNEIGSIYEQLSLFDKAETSFEWALRIYKKQIQDELGTILTMNNIGLSLIRTNQWEEAEQTFTEVIKQIKKSPEHLTLNGSGYSKLGLMASLHQNFGRLYLARASIAHAQRAPYREFATRSCQYFDEAMELHSDPFRRFEAQSGFAEALYYLEQFPEAERQLKYLEKKCLGMPAYKKLLPTIYRRLALLELVDSNVDEAMGLCFQALEVSLLFGNPVEEMEIVTTYLDTLKMIAKKLFEHVTDRTQRIRIASSQGYKLVDHLVGFLEKKDLYTGLNHSFNVCQLSVRMGEIISCHPHDFGLNPEHNDPEDSIQTDLLGLAGMLHDIGKLLVPWVIINKILPLKDEEWQLIKQHPINGYRILNSFYLEDVGKIVLEHHEKIDGSGYPRGRKKLSLMGSIIALADVYEAMTTIDRFYRRAKPKQVAQAEINELAGIHYDPRAVKAFNQAMS